MTMGMFFWVKKVVPALIVAADGSGDFTTIQAAIDALPAGGGKIFVKPGTYAVTVAIDIDKSNVTITGSGVSSKITSTGNISIFSADTQSHIIIEDLWLYGSGLGNDSNNGVEFISTTYSSVRRCLIENFGAYGVIADTPSEFCSFIDNTCLSGNVAIRIGNLSLVSNNYIKSNAGDAIMLLGANESRVHSNVCTSNLVGVAMTSTSSNNIITSNFIKSNSRDGIRIQDNSDSNIISSNSCISNSDYGVSIRTVDCNENIITNNTLLNNPDGPIRDDAPDTQIGHNITS